MKFSVSMKCPDALYEAVSSAVDMEVAELNLDADERDGVREARIEKVQKLCGKWFEYGEYLCVTVDTDAMTCVVDNQR